MEFYVKYKESQPVLVETVYNNQGETRARPLTTVAHLVAAFQALPNSPLSSVFVGDLTLHLPSGVDRSALEEECFATADSTDTTLRTGLALTQLNGQNHPQLGLRESIQRLLEMLDVGRGLKQKHQVINILQIRLELMLSCQPPPKSNSNWKEM